MLYMHLMQNIEHFFLNFLNFDHIENNESNFGNEGNPNRKDTAFPWYREFSRLKTTIFGLKLEIVNIGFVMVRLALRIN